MKKPPLNRMASGAWPVGSRKALRCRVMAGSETYGRPSSRKRLRFSSLGASPRAVKGRKPSSASSSASCAQNLALERFADERRAGAQHGDLDAL